MDILKQLTSANVMIFMKDSADHLSGKTGLTVFTISASKDGGIFQAITPTVSERGYGWYVLHLTADMTNTIGELVLHITSPDADPTDIEYKVCLDDFNMPRVLTADEVWSFQNRTLTYSPDNIQSIMDTGLMFIRGDSIEHEFTELDLENYSNVYFTIKKFLKDSDEISILQVSSDKGLIYLNGEEVEDSSLAEISVDAINSKITLKVDAGVTTQFPYSDKPFCYDVEIVYDDDTVITPVLGDYLVVRDVTRAEAKKEELPLT